MTDDVRAAAKHQVSTYVTRPESLRLADIASTIYGVRTSALVRRLVFEELRHHAREVLPHPHPDTVPGP